MKSFSRPRPSLATFSAIAAALRQKFSTCASYRGGELCQAKSRPPPTERAPFTPIFPRFSRGDVALSLLAASIVHALHSPDEEARSPREVRNAPRISRQINVLLARAVVSAQRLTVESSPRGNEL